MALFCTWGLLPEPNVVAVSLHALFNSILITQVAYFYADAKTDSVNVYKQPLPSEAAKCVDILRDMRSTVSVYLQEWPEHPVLSVLVLIIDRILSFSVTSPLMKFVSGLELLLSKAQVILVSKMKSLLYVRYYAEVCNEWRSPSMRLCAWATQLRRNFAVVATMSDTE